MASKQDYGIWILVIFIAHRVYLMTAQVNQLKCVEDILDKPKGKYGACKNGVRVYHDWSGTATPYTISCGDFVSDALTSLNCIDGDLSSNDRNKLLAHLSVLVLNLIIFFLPVPQIVYRSATAFMAFMTINGKLFGTPLLLFASVLVSLFGDVLINTLLNLAHGWDENGVDVLRSRNGRFIRRGR